MKENKATIKIDFHEIASFYALNSNTESFATLTRKFHSDVKTSLEKYESEYLSIEVDGIPYKSATSKDSTGILMFSAVTIVLSCGIGYIVDREATSKIIDQILAILKSIFVSNPEAPSGIHVEADLNKGTGMIKVTGTEETLASNAEKAKQILTSMILNLLKSQEARNDIVAKFKLKKEDEEG